MHDTHYLHTIYTLSIHYLHTIYTLSTHYLYTIYTLSAHYLLCNKITQLIVSNLSCTIHHSHCICTLFTHYLHTIYTLSTHYLRNIYTLSTQYLHTIVLATSHPGQQREEGPRGHFNSALIPHHLFWLYFIWFRIHGRYLQHYNLASWEPPICENLEKRLLGHTINVTENNKNHWYISKRQPFLPIFWKVWRPSVPIIYVFPCKCYISNIYTNIKCVCGWGRGR